MAEHQDAPNSLGLDFQHPPHDGDGVGAGGDDQQQQQPEQQPAKKERIQPYVNHDRVKTGGAQRDKPSDEALAEKMARIREQNEKIKQRRADVQADEAAFRKTQEAEQQQRARIKKVQENVDRSREANAARKMAKVQNREWDAEKRGRKEPSAAGEGAPAPAAATTGEDAHGSPENNGGETAGADADRWARGRGAPGVRGGRGRGGRGRGGRGGRGGGPTSPPTDPAPAPSAES